MNKFRKIPVTLALFLVLALNFAWVKPADALFGVADISVVTTAADIPRAIFQIGVKIGKIFLERLRSNLVKQMQNDLVNWVQGGGKPRFITDPKKFLTGAADTAAVQALDNFFGQKGVDICSPFKANLQLLVERSVFLPEQRARCTLKDIKETQLASFKQNFQQGGWRTWIALHETPNTLPGTYLAAVETIGSDISRAGNTATAQLSAGKGFLDQKNCLVYQVRVSSQELNVTETVDVREPPYNKSEGIPMNQVPSNATCAETKAITPGSVIGDQLSGALKSTGIDKIINAQELSQLINAVIDAAVNRVAREGLSLMKSGRGSYTRPVRGTYANRLAKPTSGENLGLEGIQAAGFLNDIIDFKTKSENLILNLTKSTSNKSVTANTATLAEGNKSGPGLFRKITIIGGSLVYGGPWAGAISAAALRNNKNLEYIFNESIDKKTSLELTDVLEGRLNYIFARAGNLKCSKKEKTAGKVDRCFYYGNAIDFNKEENNPGPYLANKLLHQKMSEKWGDIRKTLAGVESRLASCATSSKVPDIKYNLNPSQDELPFSTGDGRAFEWTEDSYDHAIKIEDIKSLTPASEWAQNYLKFDAIPNAEIQQEQNSAVAQAYDSLIKNNEQLKSSAEDAVKFSQKLSEKAILYTSVLLDYDHAGRDFNLVSRIREYNNALNSRSDDDIERSRTELLAAQTQTRAEWISQARTAVAAQTAASVSTPVPPATVEPQTDILSFLNGLEQAPTEPPSSGETTPAPSTASTIKTENQKKAELKLKIITEANRLIARSIILPDTFTAIRVIPNTEPVPKTAKIIERRPGNWVIADAVPFTQISEGDVALIEPGQKIPADGIIVNGETTIDEAPVTGLTGPQKKTVDDNVLAGSTNAGSTVIRVKITSVVSDPTNIGLSPTEAVGQAILNTKDDNGQPLLEQTIDQMKDELELRKSQIERMSSDLANKVGKFITDKDERISASLDGGDSEWEKYFKNRLQYAYLGMINDFYSHPEWLPCK